MREPSLTLQHVSLNIHEECYRRTITIQSNNIKGYMKVIGLLISFFGQGDRLRFSGACLLEQLSTFHTVLMEELAGSIRLEEGR